MSVMPPEISLLAWLYAGCILVLDLYDLQREGRCGSKGPCKGLVGGWFQHVLGSLVWRVFVSFP